MAIAFRLSGFFIESLTCLPIGVVDAEVLADEL